MNETHLEQHKTNNNQSFYRRARLEDFFGEDEDKNTSNKYDKNYSHSHNDNIAKNQQEFGHRKRIKP
jgi:hypothetical protein